MKKISFILLSVLIISSCSYFISLIDDGEYEVLNTEKPQLNLIFSNNINGETHPCGCRHFPLGGLPQVAGKLHELKKTGEMIYVDTGDTLFPTSILPEWLRKSLTFSAKNLAMGLDQLGLKYFVPGEKDFAGGIEFLREIANAVKFKFLLSNLKDPKTIPHIKYAKIEHGPHRIFLMGVVLPETLGTYAHLFTAPKAAIAATIELIGKAGYDEKNPFHRLIVLSHSGMDDDKELSKKYPQLDWIIGSHTQSFTTYPVEEGKTKIVQVLSRNHYLGHIKINFKKGKKYDTYQIHEIRDELAKLITPNPFDDFIINHKKQVARLQDEEQEQSFKGDLAVDKLKTANTCIGCHQSQSNHWEKTPHSIAFYTLLQVQEQNNLTCIKCHSVGQGQLQGFLKAKDIVQFDETIKEAHKDIHRKKYWDQVREALSPIKSVRKLSAKDLKIYSRKWVAIDEKNKVKHNFSNVQCLNCHDKATDHPFENNTVVIDKKERFAKIQQKCLNCHDRDQSPLWYKKDKKGFPTKLNDKKFLNYYEKISCPDHTQ